MRGGGGGGGGVEIGLSGGVVVCFFLPLLALDWGPER
jgi:hypothetical protein